jgi:hypothetical protein
VKAAAKRGWIATVTYPGNPREGHHVNFRKEPEGDDGLVNKGDRGPAVRKLTRTLATIRSPFGSHDHYLSGASDVFDEKVERPYGDSSRSTASTSTA